jgi:hypothetical protein
MKIKILILLIIISSIFFTMSVSMCAEEPCQLVKIYNERKNIFESWTQDLLELESIIEKKDELIQKGQDTDLLVERIDELNKILDFKSLRMLELSKEQGKLLKDLFSDVIEMEENYSKIDDPIEKQNIKNELDSKYECSNSLRQHIIKRRKLKDNKN